MMQFFVAGLAGISGIVDGTPIEKSSFGSKTPEKTKI